MFSDDEKRQLLGAHQVGPTVIQRLEEIGCDSFASLKDADAEHLSSLISEQLGSSCWKNSPQALTALRNAIETARGS